MFPKHLRCILSLVRKHSSRMRECPRAKIGVGGWSSACSLLGFLKARRPAMSAAPFPVLFLLPRTMLKMRVLRTRVFRRDDKSV